MARLTSDTLYGIHYLSTQECQQRLRRYGENIVILGHVIDKSTENMTAEQVAEATGHLAGDIVFAIGAPAVATFIKEIDALGKISNEAKVIARAIKNVAEEHPAYATAEGIVLKMSDSLGDIKKPLSSISTTSAKNNSTWKATNFLENKLQKHFNKHVINKAEWGMNTSMTVEGYLERARTLLNSNIEGPIEGFISKEGWVFKYNTTTNEFAVAKPDGIIETLFKPEEGMAYWLEQITKYK